MYRLALIIIIFIFLILYVFRLGAQGKISGRFRIVSLTLLCLLLALSSLGYYYSKQQTVLTVQEEFSAQKEAILQEIRNLYQEQDYSQARELAQKYKTRVQDTALEDLYRKTRQAELEQRLEQETLSPEEKLQIYQELARLTQGPEYNMLWQEQRQHIERQKEQDLLDYIQDLPQSSLGRKYLAYQKLAEVNPGHAQYKQELDRYWQSIQSRIKASHWSDICARENIEYCRHIGWLAFEASSAATSANQALGEIIGVTWRPKGTLIAADGSRAPENSYYYLLYDWRQEKLFLQRAVYVRAEKILPH